eukprot:13262294-Ditylum_brightwellii.AAC.1
MLRKYLSGTKHDAIEISNTKVAVIDTNTVGFGARQALEPQVSASGITPVESMRLCQMPSKRSSTNDVISPRHGMARKSKDIVTEAEAHQDKNSKEISTSRSKQ